MTGGALLLRFLLGSILAIILGIIGGMMFDVFSSMIFQEPITLTTASPFLMACIGFGVFLVGTVVKAIKLFANDS